LNVCINHCYLVVLFVKYGTASDANGGCKWMLRG
jgi:hypothetical protein